MYFHIIASGSKGNATVVVSNKTVLLIDMGITLKRLEEGLSEINLKKGDFIITPIETSHDATNPCGYLIKDKDSSLFYMTDTGTFLEENLPLIKDPTYLIIESNHDIKMLLHTNRPFELKNRIMSDHGHLCNEDSAIAAISIAGEHTKEIVLAHLSEEANTPETALEAYQKIFNHFGVSFDKYKIRCANQWVSLTGGDYHEN